MRSVHEGQLITLVGDEALEGIVVHAPSLVKVEVAVLDNGHGPLFRRRTAPAGRGGPRTGAGSARRGHSHPSPHRTTGK